MSNKEKEIILTRSLAWHLPFVYISERAKYEDILFNNIGLSFPQFLVMLAIKNLPDPVSPTSIAKFLGRRINTITLMLDRMKKDGLVSRRKNRKNLRILTIKLTPKGENLLNNTTEPLRIMEQEMLSCLSDDEINQYININKKLLQKILNGLNFSDDMLDEFSNRLSAMMGFIHETETGQSPVDLKSIN